MVADPAEPGPRGEGLKTMTPIPQVRIPRLPERLGVVSHFLARQTVYRKRFLAMGTEVTVTLAADRRSRAEAEAALTRTERLLIQFGIDAWAWGSGALAVFNRQLALGLSAEVPPTLRPLFLKAWQMHVATGGRYEPRIASLVRLWGFDDAVRLRSTPPPPLDIVALRQAMVAAPAFDGGSRYGPAPGCGWDFGGIGKGYIVDLALALLAQAGFDDATVDAGGHVATRGRRDNRPWRIGIRDPFASAEPDLVLASVQPGEASVVTHGVDQRGFDFEGRRLSHLLDPATGWPVEGLRSLTVVHEDGALADAGGAALFVAGPDGWPALARRLGLTQVLALRSDGRAEVTPALARRLAWKRARRPEIVD